MKTLIAAAAIGAVAIAQASPAFAFKFSPASTKFTAAGHVTILQGIPWPCTVKFHGGVNSVGKFRINSATFTGTTFCASVVPMNLPWVGTAKTATSFTITGMEFTSEDGTCGPGAITGSDNATGQFSYNTTLNPGGCGITGNQQTTPVVTIVP
jgi:hypothetical protein